MKPPQELGKGYKSITVVLKAPCFYVNLVKAPRPDLKMKAARLQHGGLHKHCHVLVVSKSSVDNHSGSTVTWTRGDLNSVCLARIIAP